MSGKKTKIVTKGVAFNILDPDQEKLLEHALKRSNFSNYVKRLIQRDIDGAFRHNTPSYNNSSKVEEPVDLDDDLMNGLV